MIEAVLNIPEEVLDLNLAEKRDETKLAKTRIIIVFLDNEFNILDVDVKTYEQWKNSDRISQKQVRLLECQRYIAPTGISPTRKGFGGQYGLSTCSPIHLKLSEKYVDSLIKNKELKKINSFEKGLTATDFFKSYSTKLVEVIKDFFTKLTYNNEMIIFEEKEIILKKNDYVLFLIPNEFIDNFYIEYTRFIQSLEDQSKSSTKKGTCAICKTSELNNLVVLPYGNFEGEQKKHKQIFHKFNDNVHYYPNALICINCFSRVDKFFKIVTQRRLFYLPIPLNVRGAGLNLRKLMFEDEKSHKLLEKLKAIYEDNNSEPFDYVLFSCTINTQGINDYKFEYVPCFDYQIKQNNLNGLSLNSDNPKKGIRTNLIQTTDLSNKSIFLREINESFIPKFGVINRLFFDAKDIDKTDAFIKTKFLQYREQIINFVFKQNPYFINVGLKNLVSDILSNIFRNKELKEYYSYDLNGKKLLLTYYRYEHEVENMKYKLLIELERKLNGSIESYKSNANIKIEINNDFEASYVAGQIVNYLLKQSQSNKDVLDILGTYMISVHNFDQMKELIVKLTQRYRHQIINTKLWGKFNATILGYEFDNKTVKDNLIGFYTGFYADNIFYTKKENKEDKNGNKNN